MTDSIRSFQPPAQPTGYSPNEEHLAILCGRIASKEAEFICIIILHSMIVAC